MKGLFGTDGIRGLVNDAKINPAMGFRIGKAIVKYCRRKKVNIKIIIGRDTRGSGLILEKALRAGIKSARGKVIAAGIIPTPGLAFLVRSQRAGAGIMISASHNPAAYNGFKFFSARGEKFGQQEEAKIERLILKEKPGGQKGINFNSRKPDANLANDYISFLLESLPPDFSLAGKKIVLDCAQGATYRIAPLVFKKLGAEIKVIAASPRGNNINKNCGSEHTDKLREEVLKIKADFGMAFDGDGDRLVAVDEQGQTLNGDRLLYIFARMLKTKKRLKNNLVISTVMSNLGFIRALAALKIKHIMTTVGDREVYKAMKKQGAILGGEESGHIIFSAYHTTGDGILSALQLTAAFDLFKKPLSRLGREMKMFPKILVNVPVKIRPVLSSVADINKAIAGVEDSLGADGRVLVRYSGTENLCRVMVEGRRRPEVKILADKIVRVIERSLNKK